MFLNSECILTVTQSKSHKTASCRGFSFTLSFSSYLAFIDSHLERMFVSHAITFSGVNREGE